MEKITQEELDEQLMKLIENDFEPTDWVDEDGEYLLYVYNKDISGLSFNLLGKADKLFNQICFYGCDMTNVDLSGVMIEGFDIVDSITDGLNLSGAMIRYGTFAGLGFSGVNWEYAQLYESYFDGCDFSNANLSNIELTGSRLVDCVFDGADMSYVTISELYGNYGGLTGVGELENCSFKNVDFSYASFYEVDDILIKNCDFSGANFDNTDMRNAELGLFDGCDLSNAILNEE